MRSPTHALLLFLTLLPLPGCWSYSAAHPQARATPAPLPASAWPKRDPEAVRPIFDATPREVFSYHIIDGVDPASLSESDRHWVERPQYTVTYKGIHADALLRIYDESADDADKIKLTSKTHSEPISFSDAINTLLLGFTPNAHIMSSRTLDSAAKHAALQASLTPPEPTPEPKQDAKLDTSKPDTSKPDTSLSVVRGVIVPTPKIEVLESTHKLHLDDGLPLRIPPAKPNAPKPKGLILHLHAIAGNPYEPEVIAEFVRRGWAVIDIKTETSIDSPIPESTHAEIRTLNTELFELNKKIFPAPDFSKHPSPETWTTTRQRAESNPLYPRYMEVQTRLNKLSAGGYQVGSDADLPAVAQEIAHNVDDGLAGAAYACQAILEYVKEERPDLQNIPIVMMGFSAGALATPTAAARVHDQLSAVVLIGGGCDLFRISQESVFTDGGLKLLCGDKKAPKSTVEKIDKLYLAATKLDPTYTAPLIADLPILQLHASTDTWVPYKTGETLYEKLNHPDRLTMHGGHEYLFYFLPGRKAWIADWVEKTVFHPPPR